MKQSVTATYLVKENGEVSLRSRHAESRGSTVPREVVARVFGPIPERGEYTVKYTLAEEGEYYILPDRVGFGVWPRLVRTGAYDEVVGSVACILPLEWKGRRINREIARPPLSERIF